MHYAIDEYGLDNIVTKGGYFLMANVFMKQEKKDIAHSMYAEVNRISHGNEQTYFRLFYVIVMLRMIYN